MSARPRASLTDQTIDTASYQDDGDTHNIVFTMSPDQYAAIQDGAPMKVQYGKDVVTHEWQFAPLDKAVCIARLTSDEPGVYQRSRIGVQRAMHRQASANPHRRRSTDVVLPRQTRQ